jgi:hypothetical protein
MFDFDSLLNKVGQFGPYQVFMYLLLCLPATLPQAWTAFNQVFVAAVPPHWCKVPGVSGEQLDAYLPKRLLRDGTTAYEPCEQYEHAPILSVAQRRNASTIDCQHGWVRVEK